MKNIISIIIPAYNIEQYIAVTLDSVLAQTYSNLEVIVVNDGSQDNTGAIIDRYAAKDSRVKAIHKDNGGVSSARNLGLDNAKGEWISFVDADDILPERALSDFLEFASCDVDIICGEFISFVENLPEFNKRDFESFRLSAEEYSRRMFMGLGQNSLCGKIYRRAILSSETFDLPKELVKGEDAIGGARIALNNSKEVVFISNVVYCYRQHLESCMHTFETTPEYEQMFYDNLWKSVPENKQKEYINYLIYYKIKTFDRMFGYSADVSRWIGSVFHKNLLYEIDKYKYKSLLIERLLLVVNNRAIREILIFLKRVKNTISFRLKQLWKKL